MKEQEQNDAGVWARLTDHDRQIASMRSDIKGIFAGLDEIRDVLVRMQENARPNLGGMVLIVVALCTFLLTVGSQALAPLKEENARLSLELDLLQKNQMIMISNRFTEEDGRRMEEMMDKNRSMMVYLYGKAGLPYPN